MQLYQESFDYPSSH